MFQKIILFLIVLLYSNGFFAQSFDNLQTYSNFGCTVKYQKEQAKLINKEVGDEYTVYHLFSTKLNSAVNQEFLIVFDNGPSDDPCFHIQLAGQQSQENGLITIRGNELILPGNGFIYAINRSDVNFEMKQKFKVEGQKIVEVKQAFYYVGIKGKTKKAITLYAEKEQKNVVANLPVEYDVEVLLNDGGDNYLIKTPFGLTGWIKITNREMYPPPGQVIEGLYYAGD